MKAKTRHENPPYASGKVSPVANVVTNLVANAGPSAELQPGQATIRRNLAVERTTPQRRVLAALWIASVLWNVLSPFKNWYLSIYEISNTEVSINYGLDWWSELDYKYVKFLYDHARVPCHVDEGRPLRLINLYVDFMVLPRARRWADGISALHHDPLVGRYCRTGLRPNAEGQAAALQTAIRDPVYNHRGKIVANYIPEQSDCHVNEVPEAILCLKGCNATQLLNLEMDSGINPSDPVVYTALAKWQQLVLPDLAACIARRQYLVTKVFPGDKDKALLALADELAVNYSLNPYGYAGKKNLAAVFHDRQGFIDINGQLSGVRKVTLLGSITERTRNYYDGDVNALTALRESIWACLFFQTIPADPLDACLQREGLRMPAIFLGDKLFRTKAELPDRFIDDMTLVAGTPRGVDGRTMAEWNYRPTPTEPVLETYLRTGNLSSAQTQYIFAVDTPLIYAHSDGPQTRSVGLPIVFLYKCIYEPGCASACHNNTDKVTAWDFVFAVRKSGYCYRERFVFDLFRLNGFVSERCYGVGTGSSTLFFKLDPLAAATHGWQNAPGFFEIPNVADPMAVLACIMGGRVPVQDEPPFPSGFQNMVALGTGMVLSITFGDGSERVLANMYVLASLAGATLYASLVLIEVLRMGRLARQPHHKNDRTQVADQVTYSVSVTTLSFRVWRLHYSLLSFIGFFTIFSWLLGSSQTQCSWYLHDRLVRSIPADEINISAQPTYKCDAGDSTAHLTSLFEIARTLSSSVVVCFILIGRRHMIGISRTLPTLSVALVFYGIVPCLLLPVIIIELNQLRLKSTLLEKIHNQLFMATACALSLVAWKLVLPLYDRLTVLPSLRLLGAAPRSVQSSSKAGQMATLTSYCGQILGPVERLYRIRAF